jgi:hypothetical protein
VSTVKKGDAFNWNGVRVQVTRAAKDGSWADIWCMASIWEVWTKRQSLPFPASFVFIPEANR